VVVAALVYLLQGGAGAAQRTIATPPEPHPARVVHASRVSRPPIIDGHLTDDGWAQASPATEFTQRDPDEGRVATQKTEIRFLFDDAALYIGARMFDTDATHIVRRMSSRDDFADADSIGFYLDPLHDHLTGALFRLSAANVQQDAVIYNDTWTDGSWDAVWESAVAVDDTGWTAEIRIPLSQLRFAPGDRQVWGVNVERTIRRNNESSWLAMVPKAENGMASRMIDLAGLDGLKPSRRLELLPYAAARGEFIMPQHTNDPFNDGARAFGAAGLDMKWGLTSNLTINATVNPDFGQVEVDPAVVNLTAFETFFQEKRPFFLEGAQIFNNYGRLGANDFWGFDNSEPQTFYSRRIGRAPQLSATGDYTDTPNATTILGAVKLTGKTSNGWSLGFLNAVTGEEQSRVETGVERSRTLVEPLSNYSVVRVERDLGPRAGVGLLTTTVNRQLPDERVRTSLAEGAYVYGADGYWFVDRAKVWAITGNIAGSLVRGSSDVIARLQQAPQRYFQRPDEPHVHFDPTRTSLSGFTGRINLNRNQGKYWRLNSALWAGSPGFESNDLGFLSTGDRAGAHSVLVFRNTQPTRVSRQWTAWVSKWWAWNFGRELQGDGVSAHADWQFLNYWDLNSSMTLNRRVLDDRLTRGGPPVLSPGGAYYELSMSSDGRKPLSLGAFANRSTNEFGAVSANIGTSVTIKPSSRVILDIEPQWNRQTVVAQYVTTVADPLAAATFGNRYVFGSLEQRQLSMTTRASVILTPRVSFRFFMQPLLADGQYSGFKELARSRSFDFLRYGDATSTLAYDGASRTYSADPDGSGDAAALSFENPDFNLKSLRLNAVFRWELKPGSTVYAVWTRQQQDLSNPGRFAPGRDVRVMFGAPGDDVVLVKFAYWLGH
jgi:hypothetical protein